MTTLEDRLRAAYQDAAGTVTRETMPSLAELTRPGRPRPRPEPRPLARMLMPMAAAMVVTAVVLVAVVVPRAVAGPWHPPLLPASLAYVVTDSGRSATSLEVHRTRTGALVGRVTLPSPVAGRSYLGAVATGNDRTFVIAVYRTAPCRSWLYRFRLGSGGKPLALVPLPALPSITNAVTELAVSEDGQELAYVTSNCTTPAGYPSTVSSLAVTAVSTGQTRRWPFPARMRHHVIRFLSLTADGSRLAFSDWSGFSAPIRVMSASAAPGNVQARSRIALRPAISRASGTGVTDFAAISATGSTVYLSTSTSYGAGNVVPGEVLAGNVHTGRLRQVEDKGEILTASPSARYLLLAYFVIPPGFTCTGPKCLPLPPRPSLYPYLPHMQLAWLDPATGKPAFLPSSWVRAGTSSFTW